MRLQELIQVRQERDLQSQKLAQGREEIEQQSKLAEQRLRRIAELDSELAQLTEQVEGQRKTTEERGQQIVELLREVERLNAELEKQQATTPLPREQGRDADAKQDRMIDRGSSGGLIHRLRSSLSWMMIAALGVIALVVVALWRLIRLM
jgi:chromosome segregation ATPase